MDFKISLLCLLLILSCKPKDTVEISSWQVLESADGSAPIARHEAAFVHVGHRMYLLGGRDVRPISIYDISKNTWLEGPKPPLEIHHFQPVVVEDTIYIIGAFTGKWPNETPVANIIKYDTGSDEWIIGDEIPKERRRGAAGAAVQNDKIYIACGLANGHIGDHKNWLDTYDLKTKSWQVLPDAPRTRDHFNAVIADEKLYLLAGRNTETGDNPFGNTIGEVDVFDMINETWSTLKNEIPNKRAGNAALLFEEDILVIGGESDTQESAHNHVDALSVKSHEWTSNPPLKQGRHGTGVVAYGGQMYIASGCGKRGGEPELNTFECYKVESKK